MARSNSLFKKRELPKKELRIKIDSEVIDDHDSVQKRLKELAPELEFDLNDYVERSVRSAIASAQRELEQLEKQKEPANAMA